MTRTMLKEKGLPKQFWAEAVVCSTYLHNRCLTKSVKNMTPQEAWSGYKPSMAHQVPEVKRKKLDDNGEKFIFIGYNEESKAYKLYNPLTKKVVVSRDVVLNEEEVWSQNDEETPKVQPDMEELEELSPCVEPLGAPPSPQPATPSTVQRGSPPSVRGRNNASSTPIRMKSLREIYSQTEDGETNLFCLYADHEPPTFQEAMEEDCWRTTMKQEIHAIEKNDTWELTTLPQD